VCILHTGFRCGLVSDVAIYTKHNECYFSSCTVVQRNNRMINPFYNYLTFIQTFSLHLQYMQHALHQYSAIQFTITHKPISQTTSNRLAYSLFLSQSAAGRFTASTVRINNVSVTCFYVGL
jgi:hypothetical protein